MWVLPLVIILLIVTYLLIVKPLSYWKEKCIPYVKNPLPIIGNLKLHVTGKRAFSHILEDFYYEFPTERYVGFYQFLLPTLIIRDPKLIKEITIKDFDTFPEHRTFVTEDIDPLFGKSIFAMKGGTRWHTARSTLSPSFTSSKLKAMFGFMHECAKQFTNYYGKSNALVTLEMKNAFTKYTNDNVASSVFGVACDSFENPENEFYMMGKEATDFSGLKNMKFMLFAIHPILPKLLGCGIFSNKVSNFFRNLVKETIKIREEQNIIRPDVLYLLTEARKAQLNLVDRNVGSIITDDDITGNALVFFTAGFDTSSTLLCFTCYELAVNPNIQQKLFQEIVETPKLSFESLLSMKYLDMVVSETLRKWPPAMQTDRVSTKPYRIKSENSLDKFVQLDKGTNIWIPIFAIHRDSKYYPNPLKFDPERFNVENKKQIQPFTYLPFGAGPRFCIGSRFALLQSKLLLVEVLRKFEIVPVEKTQIPLKLSCYTFNPSAENGCWLGLKPRGVR